MNLNHPFYIDKRAGENHISLDGVWSFTSTDNKTEAPEKLDYSLEATIPASTFLNLKETGVLPDPYYGTNSKLYDDVDRKIWYYKRTFTIENDILPNLQDAFLCFEGVSYYSRIWLNGISLGEHRGMLGGPVCEVSEFLKKGENEVIVEVVAPTFGKEGPDRYFNYHNFDEHTEIIPWNVSRDINTSTGDFVVMGIWRSVRLEIVPKLHISRPYLYTQKLEGNNALLQFEVSITNEQTKELETLLNSSRATKNNELNFPFREGLTGILSDQTVDITVSIYDEDKNECIYDEKEPFTLFDYEKSGITTSTNDCQFYSRQISLNNIEPWQPVGLGTPKLYKVIVLLEKDGEKLDEISFNTGIRTIQKFYSEGRKYKQRWEKYWLEINGKKIFLKGMNWMPVDFLYETNEKDIEWALELARNCGIQLLRVWSGGSPPESDVFYDICDRLGIMVWQDSLLANLIGKKWSSDDMENQICYNLFRMRNHPSLVIHCGGNEFECYRECFDKQCYVIQRNVEDIDPSKLFYRASPDGGSMHIYRDMEPVWYRKGYKELPFVAESGIHSFPNAKSVRQVISEKEYTQKLGNIVDPSFKERFPELVNHFSEYNPERIPRMLARASHISDVTDTTLEKLCEASQLAAFEFYQIMIQSMRENYPKTVGIMPWVFKRTWTTTAIQLVDGLGEPTAQYYAVKNAYNDTIVFASLEEVTYAPLETVKIPLRVICDTPKDVKGRAVIEVFSPDFKLVESISSEFEMNSEEYICSPIELAFNIPESYCDAFFFVRTSIYEDEMIISSAFYPLSCLGRMRDEQFRRDFRENTRENLIFENGPHMRDQIIGCEMAKLEAEILSKKVKGERTTISVRLKTDKPVYPVKLEVCEDKTVAYHSDNYFFMNSEEEKTVTMEIRNKGNAADSLTLNITAWTTEPIRINI